MRGLAKKIYDILDREQRRGFVLLLFIILISSALELIGVSAIMPLVSAVTDPGIIDTNEKYRAIRDALGITDVRQYIFVMAVVLALIYVVKNFFLIWMKWMEFRYIYENQKKISVRLVDCYIKQDYIYHVQNNVADLQRNATSDVTNCFTVLQCVLNLITEVLVCGVLVVYLAITDIWTTLVMGLLMGALLGGFMVSFKRKLRILGERSRELSAVKSKWFLQAFSGIKEIKAGNRETYFLGKYTSSYDEFTDICLRQSMMNYVPKPLAEMMCISGILVFLAIRILIGADIAGFVPVLSVFAIAAFRMLPSFNRISGDLAQLLFNKASLDALYEDLREVEELGREAGAQSGRRETAMTLQRQLELSHVRFAYPTKPEVTILGDVSLTVPSKSAVALVGPSGAGKTTLADVVLGLYRPDAGTVMADGVDVQQDMDAWHRAIGYIPQSIYLIDDTVRANVAFGIPEDEVDDEAVWRALESAQLADYVREQPQGLDSNIGDRGVKISGGQRQRIGIARALYTNPELLILDEATSALDNDTESAVMEAIYHLAGKVTMIVIAHRLTTIKNCDIIYHVEAGKVTQISYEEAVGE